MRVLLYSVGSLGDVNPFLVVAEALQSAGHQVRFLTIERHREICEARGIPFATLGDDNVPMDAATTEKIFDPRGGAEFLFTQYIIPELRKSYEIVNREAASCDHLISGSLAFGAHLVHGKTGIPWTSIGLQPSIYLSPLQFPVAPEMPWLRFLTDRSPFVSSCFLKLLRHRVDAVSGEWHKLRRELDLPGHANILLDASHSPERQLAAFPEWFVSRKADWPACREQIGFLLREPEAEPPLPEALEAFLDAGAPPIVFTLGSAAIYAGENVIGIFQDYLRQYPQRAVIACGHLAENWRGKFPADVFVSEAVSYARLFPRARLVVHQGGINTTAEALRAGRPMVVVPFGHDQYDNAVHAERLGAGSWTPRKGLNVAKLHAAIERTRDFRSCRELVLRDTPLQRLTGTFFS